MEAHPFLKRREGGVTIKPYEASGGKPWGASGGKPYGE